MAGVRTDEREYGIVVIVDYTFLVFSMYHEVYDTVASLN